MKSSMQTRLIMISSGMLVLAIACICFANIFWLPYYYQSEKVSNMKNAYNNVVKQVSGVEWSSLRKMNDSDLFPRGIFLYYCGETERLKSILELILYALKSQNIKALGFKHPDEFSKALLNNKPQIVVLDLMLQSKAAIIR